MGARGENEKKSRHDKRALSIADRYRTGGDNGREDILVHIRTCAGGWC